MMKSELTLVYTTFQTRTQAQSVIETLLNEALIACANMFEITSLYKWEGEIKNVPEIGCIIKTSQEKSKTLEKRLEALHPYETPCIIFLGVESASSPFTTWVTQSLSR